MQWARYFYETKFEIWAGFDTAGQLRFHVFLVLFIIFEQNLVLDNNKQAKTKFKYVYYIFLKSQF